MNKREVQKRVSQHGKKLALSKFNWDKKTRCFSSEENDLVIDFAFVPCCTFTTGHHCTFATGPCCTFTTRHDCTFTTSHDCTFTTGYGCTFTTGYGCTFNTRHDCTFTTRHDCTFNTGSECVFNTHSNCTFNTGSDCVLLRKDTKEVITDLNNTQIASHKIKGYVKNGIYSETGKPAIIADGILSEIVSKRRNVYKVINHGYTKASYLIEVDGIYSHGETLKEAKESLLYKISNRDKSQYNDYTLNTRLTKEVAIKMYRVITGACESGTRNFVKSLDTIPEKLTVAELIKITKGKFGNDTLEKFIKGDKNE